jgi:hypothetical protein
VLPVFIVTLVLQFILGIVNKFRPTQISEEETENYEQNENDKIEKEHIE